MVNKLMVETEKQMWDDDFGSRHLLDQKEIGCCYSELAFNQAAGLEADLQLIDDEAHSLKRIYGNLPYEVLATDWQGNLVFINEFAKKSLAMEVGDSACCVYYGRPPSLPPVLREMVTETISTGREIEERPLVYLADCKTFVGNCNLKQYNRESIPYRGFSFFLADSGGQPSLALPTVLLTLLPEEIKEDVGVNDQTVVAQLAAGLANKTLNPLTTVKGFMQLMCEQEENRGGDTAYLHSALDELDIANRHLRDFIMCLQPAMPQVEVISADSLIIEAVAKLADFAAQHEIRVKIEYAKDPLLLKCDQNQLVKALYHVISNAIDYSEHGGTVCIRVGFDEDADMAKIVVKDYGKGIPSRLLEKIFEPYYSTSSSKVGLGLTIARALLENNSAVIVATSALKMGSEIWMLIPGVSGNKHRHRGEQLSFDNS